MSRALVCPGAPPRRKRDFSLIDDEEPPAPPAFRLPPLPEMNANQNADADGSTQNPPALPQRQVAKRRRGNDAPPERPNIPHNDAAPAA